MIMLDDTTGFEQDIRDLVGAFHVEHLSDLGLDLSDETVESTLDLCRDHMVILVDDQKKKCVGVIGGFLARSLMGKKIMWQEVMWYVRPEYRRHGIRLYKAMEAKLYAEGIQQMVMVSIANDFGEKLNNIYRALGYKHLETQYIKDLGE